MHSCINRWIHPCIHWSMHAHMCIYSNTRAHIHTYTHIHYMYLCVCVCVCMYVYIYIYKHAYTYKHTCTLFEYTLHCLFVHHYMYTHTYIHKYIHTIYICAQVHTYMYNTGTHTALLFPAWLYVYMHTHTHTHTHTHKYILTKYIHTQMHTCKHNIEIHTALLIRISSCGAAVSVLTNLHGPIMYEFVHARVCVCICHVHGCIDRSVWVCMWDWHMACIYLLMCPWIHIYISASCAYIALKICMHA